MFLVLLDAEGRKYGVNAQGGMARSPGFGTFDIAKLEANVGHKVTVGERSFIVLRSSNRDLHETISRGAQVLTPKSLGALLYEADVAAGIRVLGAGAGSGALTASLRQHAHRRADRTGNGSPRRRRPSVVRASRPHRLPDLRPESP